MVYRGRVMENPNLGFLSFSKADNPNLGFLSFSKADNPNLGFLSFSKADILKMARGGYVYPNCHFQRLNLL